jgi:hypothetical protein
MAHLQTGHAGQELGSSAMATESLPALWRRLRLAGGRGRGPGGPLAYPELAGEVGLAGGEAGGEQFEAAVVRTCERIGDGGSYSRRGSSIASSRRKRTARGRCEARRRSRGWRGTAATELGSGGGSRGRETERKRGSPREKKDGKERGRRRGAVGRLQGSPRQLGGKQEVATAGTWEPPRRCSTKKTNK